MKAQALSIYKAHLAIMLHHFQDAPKYQQHTAAKKAAVREVVGILKIGWNLPHYENIEGSKHWKSILTELNKL